MPDFLSQEEIDSLLDIADQGEEEENRTNSILRKKSKSYSLCDIKRFNHLSLDEIDFISENSNNIELENFNVSLYSVEFLDFKDFFYSMSDISFVSINSIKDTPFFGVINIEPFLAEKIIDYKCTENKDYSAEELKHMIDSNINLFEEFCDIFTESIKEKLDFNFMNIKNISNNKLSVVNPYSKIILLVYEVSTEDYSGFFSIAIEQEFFAKHLRKDIHNEDLFNEKIICEKYSIKVPIKKIKKLKKIKIKYEKFQTTEIDIPFVEVFNKFFEIKPVLSQTYTENIKYNEEIEFENNYNDLISLKIGNSLIGEGKLVIFENSELGIKIEHLNLKKMNNIKIFVDVFKIKDRYFLGRDNILFYEIKEDRLKNIKSIKDLL